MTYALEAADALATVREAGVAVTFTSSQRSVTRTSTGETMATTTTTVDGAAVQMKGDSDKYRDLGLVTSSPNTLLFVPTTYGEMPPLGASVSWGGQVCTVKAIDPFAPGGTAIYGIIVVAR